MKIVITGGAGFIGSHLAEQFLQQNCEVVIIDNFANGRLQNIPSCFEKLHTVRADISQIGEWYDSFKDADQVYHLAALADIVPSIEDPVSYYQSNVTGTFNVLEASRQHKAQKFIYAASASCYGLSETTPTPESAQIDPQYPYAITKRLGEELVLHWDKIYNLNALSLRLFNVYGPRSRTNGAYGAMFGVFLAQKLANLPMTVVGDGEQERDFVHVSDVVSAFIKAGKSNLRGLAINIGTGSGTKVNTIVELLGGSKVYIPERPAEPKITQADISRAKNLLKWSPKVSIEDGIKDMLSSIEYWRDAPVWTPDKIEKQTAEWFAKLSK